jgi:hypothetical protein
VKPDSSFLFVSPSNFYVPLLLHSARTHSQTLTSPFKNPILPF